MDTHSRYHLVTDCLENCQELDDKAFSNQETALVSLNRDTCAQPWPTQPTKRWMVILLVVAIISAAFAGVPCFLLGRNIQRQEGAFDWFCELAFSLGHHPAIMRRHSSWTSTTWADRPYLHLSPSIRYATQQRVPKILGSNFS